MEETTSTRAKKLKATVTTSAGVGTIGALLLGVIAKYADANTKEILTLAVPFVSVWILAIGTWLVAVGKWLGIAYGFDEPTVVKLRRQTKKYRKKLLKELNGKSTSEENKAKIRARLDELQMVELESYEIK